MKMLKIYNNKMTSLKIVTATIFGILTLTNAAEAYEPHEHPWKDIPASTFWRKLDTQQEGYRYCKSEFYNQLYSVSNFGGSQLLLQHLIRSLLQQKIMLSSWV